MCQQFTFRIHKSRQTAERLRNIPVTAQTKRIAANNKRNNNETLNNYCTYENYSIVNNILFLTFMLAKSLNTFTCYNGNNLNFYIYKGTTRA